ncbi:VapE domain-containing protein [Methylocystis parvus]|uniref:VapE domain-containing protein n=1 Tax=Methylocystis parvus TaxID=134 RepID=UPI003C78FC33
MRRLGIAFAFDKFRYRKTVEVVAIQEYQGDLSDDACAKLRHAALEKLGFDPGKENIRDAAHALSLENPHHPVRDYLGALKWDGVARLERWLTTYLGAEDTELNAAIGRIILIAAVRRIRFPGAKFDTIMVLEGPQGGGKATAIKILAGEENFSDQDILTLDHKSQMEALEGVWIYEIAELEGLSRADTTKVKAFISRTDDRARPAYGRFIDVRPRQAVFIGTTNDDRYLRGMSGNRRFWPVKTGVIDLAALRRDRDQLWAEAAHCEESEASIILPEELWLVAAAEQEARLEEDPWQEKLADIPSTYLHASGEFVRVSTFTLINDILKIPTEKQHQQHAKRLAGIMRKLGWRRTAAAQNEGLQCKGLSARDQRRRRAAARSFLK